jgi:hypothetical protein
MAYGDAFGCAFEFFIEFAAADFTGPDSRDYPDGSARGTGFIHRVASRMVIAVTNRDRYRVTDIIPVIGAFEGITFFYLGHFHRRFLFCDPLFADRAGL